MLQGPLDPTIQRVRSFKRELRRARSFRAARERVDVRHCHPPEQRVDTAQSSLCPSGTQVSTNWHYLHITMILDALVSLVSDQAHGSLADIFKLSLKLVLLRSLFLCGGVKLDEQVDGSECYTQLQLHQRHKSFFWTQVGEWCQRTRKSNWCRNRKQSDKFLRKLGDSPGIGGERCLLVKCSIF